jgi:hypothetical protein
MTATILTRRPLVRRDFRRGLRRFSMRNEAMAYYDAHPLEWAELIAIMEEAERQLGPVDPLPSYTRSTLRGEIFREKG